MFTCILLIIMSCSTSGCVSPVRFMVPSNMMKAWTDGNNAFTGWSHCTDSIIGILKEKGKRYTTKTGMVFKSVYLYKKAELQCGQLNGF